MSPTIRTPWRSRIAARIEEARNGKTNDECWLWPLAIGSDGYGRFSWFGYEEDGPQRTLTAHRVAWQYANGIVNPNLVLDHLCRNRACINPLHLDPVTSAVNFHRGEGPSSINRRKTHCIRGHELSGANLHVTPKGRSCRACHAERERLRRVKERATRPPKPEKTHCSQGHLLDVANTYIYRGYKRCKTCRRTTENARYKNDPVYRAKLVAKTRAARND